MLIYSPNFRLEKKTIFVLSLVLPGGPPRALVPVSAQSDLGLVYFIFHCNDHVTSFFIRHWELRFDVALELGLLRELSCGVRSFDGESGSLAMRSVQYRRVLPQWQCRIERIPPERPEGYCHSDSAVSRGYRRNVPRPISQACTRRLCSPRQGARPPASSSRTKLKNFRASRTPRASSRDFHADTNILRNIKNKK